MNQNKKPLENQVFTITTNPQLPTTQLPLLLHSFSTMFMMKMQADFWNLNKVHQSSNHSNLKDNNNKKVNNNNNLLKNRKKVNNNKTDKKMKKTNQKEDNNKKVNRNNKNKKKENNKLNQLKSLMV